MKFANKLLMLLALLVAAMAISATTAVAATTFATLTSNATTTATNTTIVCTTAPCTTVTPAGAFNANGSGTLVAEQGTLTCNTVTATGTVQEDGTGTVTITYGATCSGFFGVTCVVNDTTATTTIEGDSTWSSGDTVAGTITSCDFASLNCTVNATNIGGTFGGTVDNPTVHLDAVTNTTDAAGDTTCDGNVTGNATVDDTAANPTGTINTTGNELDIRA